MTSYRVKRGFSIFAVALAFLLGGLLGWGVTKSFTDTTSTDGLSTVGIGGGPVDPAPTDTIRVRLTNLLKEHGNMAVIHLQAIYDGKDTTPTATQLDTNSQNITNLIAEVFGEHAADMFLPIWKEHLNQYMNYTQGLKTGNEDMMIAAKERLNQLSVEKGNMMHDLNDNISSSEVTNMMNEHVALTLAIIDAHARGDQQNMVEQIKMANDQAVKFANYLSDRIAVEQNAEGS